MRVNLKLKKINCEEIQFIKALVNDDSKAWQQFFQRYEKLIYSCISRIITKFKTNVAQDEIYEIYGNVMLNLLNNDKQKLRLYDPQKGHSFSSWIGLITINTTYDYLRKVQRMPQIQNSAELYLIPATEHNPYEHVATREEWNEFLEYIQKMSSKDRLFIYLYFYLGLPPEQIALKMGISVKTVYSKKHKIRNRLISSLHKHFYSNN